MASKPSRAPDFFERYYICRDTCGYLNKGFNISARLSRPVNDAVLSQALRATVLAHPHYLLHMVRADGCKTADPREEDAKANGTNYEVQFVEKLAFSDVVRHASVPALNDEELARLATVRTPCDVSTPSWYLNVCETDEGQYLTFACNHVFFDGRSAVHFFDDLVKALAAVTDKLGENGETELSSEVAFVDTLFDSSTDNVDMPPASSEVVNLYQSSWWFALKTIGLYFLPTPLKKLWKYWWGISPKRMISVSPLTAINPCAFRRVHLDAAQAASLLARCRKLGVTITSYLAASVCHALDNSVVPALGGSFVHSLKLVVCGRRHYPNQIDATRYGLYVSPATDYVASGSDLNETARTVSQRLSASTGNRALFWMTGLLNYINIWDHFRGEFDGKHQRATIEISNVGMVRIEHGSWAVDDMVFSQGVTTTHITLSVISTPHGGLNIVMATHDELCKVENEGIPVIDTFYKVFEADLTS
ncbi:Alcohol acetyltransferase family protein [Clavispora lusitaniae]|uniref:Alcohol acetyltransferase n=1 Tax=Clavispora lusitaniae (strain ATCC 42720) TaxID=306902 RepID=C4XZR4_CLAL4|nr:uncharacterized protein CLUG_01446 [Clavispora lusitaniae ATCC 42720]EEQ37323.1 hypothetical protein CLUG_01446 [Clavispora lusitaniae ATCC 42720]KAF7583705.1 Alcohol acetyltransferase family protein [Clavispora lusitaniae]